MNFICGLFVALCDCMEADWLNGFVLCAFCNNIRHQHVPSLQLEEKRKLLYFILYNSNAILETTSESVKGLWVIDFWEMGLVQSGLIDVLFDSRSIYHTLFVLVASTGRSLV